MNADSGSISQIKVVGGHLIKILLPIKFLRSAPPVDLRKMMSRWKKSNL